MAATGMPLRWMTFSYIVSLFLDCPPNYGVLQVLCGIVFIAVKIGMQIVLRR
eukprot:SAG11_NODE_38260_length_253_cov_0.662338_1_plen_51_part_01